MTTSEGERLKAVGMARAATTDAEWVAAARTVVLSLSPGMRVWADRLTSRIGLPPNGSLNNNAAVGSVFGTLSKSGDIKHVGTRKSERPERHVNRQSIWERT